MTAAIGTSRYFAVLQNLVAIGAWRTLASYSPGIFMDSRLRLDDLTSKLVELIWHFAKRLNYNGVQEISQ